MAKNPWGEDERNGGSLYGTGDAFGATDAGQMDAIAIQNQSHTGPQLSEGERQMISGRITQMVAEGRNVRDIPDQFPGVDATLIQQYIQQAQNQTDVNPFDNMPGNPQPQQQQVSDGPGLLGGLLGGLAGAATAMAPATGIGASLDSSERGTIGSISSRLLDRPEPAVTDMRNFGNGVQNFEAMQAEASSQYVVAAMGKQRQPGVEVGNALG